MRMPLKNCIGWLKILRIIMDNIMEEDYVNFEVANKVHDRMIIDEYYADGEWHYEYKI